jgi:hypothetical protein
MIEKDSPRPMTGNLGNEGERSIEARWDELKRTITEVAEEQLVRKRFETKKP